MSALIHCQELSTEDLERILQQDDEEQETEADAALAEEWEHRVWDMHRFVPHPEEAYCAHCGMDLEEHTTEVEIYL